MVTRALSAEERFVLAGRCGWENRRTLQQTADALGTYRERVRATEATALRKLRDWRRFTRRGELPEETYLDLVRFWRPVAGLREEEAD